MGVKDNVKLLFRIKTVVCTLRQFIAKEKHLPTQNGFHVSPQKMRAVHVNVYTCTSVIFFFLFSRLTRVHGIQKMQYTYGSPFSAETRIAEILH